MNEYAKIGHEYLTAISDYFAEFESRHGLVRDYLGYGKKWPSQGLPDSNRILTPLSALHYPEDYSLPIYPYGLFMFSGWFGIGSPIGPLQEPISVDCNEMGMWQAALLLIASMHIMPLYQHSRYMQWRLILCEEDLLKFRLSKRQYESTDETYSFIPKSLPCTPIVKYDTETKTFNIRFHFWSDFGGYMEAKLTSKYTPKGTISNTTPHTDIEHVEYGATVPLANIDFDIQTKNLYGYHCCAMF